MKRGYEVIKENKDNNWLIMLVTMATPISSHVKDKNSIFTARDEDIENTSWKVLAYGIYARVVDVSEIERVSAANE